MELELDRLRRDLERCEDELARVRRELADAETRAREREGVVDKMVSLSLGLDQELIQCDHSTPRRGTWRPSLRYSVRLG